MMPVCVTAHAINRYIERVAPVARDKAESALSSPAFDTAAKFGARCVILGTGHRAILQGWRVVTVLPHRRRPRG